MYAHQSISSVHRLGSKLFVRPSYVITIHHRYRQMDGRQYRTLCVAKNHLHINMMHSTHFKCSKITSSTLTCRK